MAATDLLSSSSGTNGGMRAEEFDVACRRLGTEPPLLGKTNVHECGVYGFPDDAVL